MLPELHDHVAADQLDKAVIAAQELLHGCKECAVVLELFGLKAVGLICLDELRDLLEAVEIELINGLVHVVLDLHPVAVSELSLPVGSDGEDDVAAEEINIVVIVSVSSGQQSSLCKPCKRSS